MTSTHIALTKSLVPYVIIYYTALSIIARLLDEFFCNMHYYSIRENRMVRRQKQAKTFHVNHTQFVVMRYLCFWFVQVFLLLSLCFCYDTRCLYKQSAFQFKPQLEQAISQSETQYYGAVAQRQSNIAILKFFIKKVVLCTKFVQNSYHLTLYALMVSVLSISVIFE